MNFKLLNRNNRMIILILLFIIGIFMIEYPEHVKNRISDVYKKRLSKAAGKLDDKQKKKVEDELTAFVRGTSISEKSHDTNDFMHQDYFGEPWRKWTNSYVIWAHARDYFLLLFFLVILKNVHDDFRDRILHFKVVKR